MAHIIDAHTHFGDREIGRELGVGNVFNVTPAGDNAVMTYKGLSAVSYGEFFDFDRQREVNKKAGVTRLLSTSFTLEDYSQFADRPSVDIARLINDRMAATVARAPDELFAMGTANPNDAAHVAEAERCLDQLGFKGIQCTSSWHGRFLDGEESYPFWEWAEDRGVTVFVHPPRAPIGHAQQMNQYKLDETVGRPFDSTMCIARMILSGLFDRFPGLNILIAHMGGGLMPVAGRLDFGHRLGYDEMPEEARARCKLMPSEYFRRNLYVDTMGFWAPHVREVIEVFGADRVLFGTDYGPVPIDPAEHIDIVKSMGLTPADEDKVFWRNADRLFSLGLA